MDKQETEVVALKVTPTHIIFECPYCWSKYKANGEPSKTATRVYHKHGSGNNFENRVEQRGAHCSTQNKNVYKGDFKIIINDTTIKETS